MVLSRHEIQGLIGTCRRTSSCRHVTFYMVQWPAVQIPEHSSQVSRDSFSRCVHSKAFFKMRRMLHRMAHREFERPLLQGDTKGAETSSSGTRFRGNFSMSSAPLSWRPSCCPHKNVIIPSLQNGSLSHDNEFELFAHSGRIYFPFPSALGHSCHFCSAFLSFFCC